MGLYARSDRDVGPDDDPIDPGDGTQGPDWYQQQTERVRAALASRGLHRITERADGPDLDDMMRLVRFLRSSQVEHYSIGSVHRGEDGPEQCRMTVSWWSMDRRPGAKHAATIGGSVEEREPLPDAVFVGPDGMSYDANREAL